MISALAAIRTHYPRIKYVNGERMLWNPVLKKSYKNRPEERVRLSLVDYLLLEAGWSSQRISFEASIRDVHGRSDYRTDVICYAKDVRPLILCECKAPGIALNQDVALQATRYNLALKAPYVLVTNGSDTLLFETSEDHAPREVTDIQQVFPVQNKVERDFPYWSERGCVGADMEPSLRKGLVHLMHLLYIQSNTVAYLQWDVNAPVEELDAYYGIVTVDEGVKMAISSQNDAFGGTRITAILSKQGKNVGILEWYPVLQFRGTQPSMFLTNKKERHAIESPPALLEVLYHDTFTLHSLLSSLIPLF